MAFTYKTKGTCATEMSFEVVDNKLSNLQIKNGCSGNLQGMIKLTDGMDIDEVVEKLKGIKCRTTTSCPDQLAQAILAYKESIHNV